MNPAQQETVPRNFILDLVSSIPNSRSRMEVLDHLILAVDCRIERQEEDKNVPPYDLAELRALRTTLLEEMDLSEKEESAFYARLL